MRSDRVEHHPDLPLPILFRPMRSARRLRLRLDEQRQLLTLTHPRGMARKTALRWALDQRGWVGEQIGRQLPGEPLRPGAIIPLDGRDVILHWAPDGPRSPRLDADRIVAGGPESAFPGRIERFLRRHALDTLSRETAAIAKRSAKQPAAVAIGDARTRWGSCSSGGRLRYSWRLILAPPDVRRYVVAHEVAHLTHLNHGPHFRQLEHDLFGGDVSAARLELRRLGPRLKRIGRGG